MESSGDGVDFTENSWLEASNGDFSAHTTEENSQELQDSSTYNSGVIENEDGSWTCTHCNISLTTQEIVEQHLAEETHLTRTAELDLASVLTTEEMFDQHLPEETHLTAPENENVDIAIEVDDSSKQEASKTDLAESTEANMAKRKHGDSESNAAVPDKKSKTAQKEKDALALLQPGKNSLALLHEYRAGTQFKLVKQTGTANKPEFKVQVEVDGVMYTGFGPSKKKAEHLLADKIVEKLRPKMVALFTKREKEKKEWKLLEGEKRDLEKRVLLDAAHGNYTSSENPQLQFKSSMDVLFEIQPGSRFYVNRNAHENTYTATLVLEGLSYEGISTNKNLAKAIAAEWALTEVYEIPFEHTAAGLPIFTGDPSDYDFLRPVKLQQKQSLADEEPTIEGKNPVMLLNELFPGKVDFDFVPIAWNSENGIEHHCFVHIEGKRYTFEGRDRTKKGSKLAAAMNAIYSLQMTGLFDRKMADLDSRRTGVPFSVLLQLRQDDSVMAKRELERYRSQKDQQTTASSAVQQNAIAKLNQLYPGLVYEQVDVVRDFGTPQGYFSLQVTVKEQQYIGQGPNKKAAKLDAAENALQGLGLWTEADEGAKKEGKKASRSLKTSALEKALQAKYEDLGVYDDEQAEEGGYDDARGYDETYGGLGNDYFGGYTSGYGEPVEPVSELATRLRGMRGNKGYARGFGPVGGRGETLGMMQSEHGLRGRGGMGMSGVGGMIGGRGVYGAGGMRGVGTNRMSSMFEDEYGTDDVYGTEDVLGAEEGYSAEDMSGLGNLYGAGGMRGAGGMTTWGGGIRGAGGLRGMRGAGGMRGVGGLGGVGGMRGAGGFGGVGGMRGAGGFGGVRGMRGAGGFGGVGGMREAGGLAGVGGMRGTGGFGGVGGMRGAGGLAGVGGMRGRGGFGGVGDMRGAGGFGGVGGMRGARGMRGPGGFGSMRGVGGLRGAGGLMMDDTGEDMELEPTSQMHSRLKQFTKELDEYNNQSSYGGGIRPLLNQRGARPGGRGLIGRGNSLLGSSNRGFASRSVPRFQKRPGGIQKTVDLSRLSQVNIYDSYSAEATDYTQTNFDDVMLWND